MMLLIDSINFRTDFFNEDAVLVIQELGGICELEMTLVRDLQRWNKGSVEEINMYTFWLIKKGLLM